LSGQPVASLNIFESLLISSISGHMYQFTDFYCKEQNKQNEVYANLMFKLSSRSTSLSEKQVSGDGVIDV